MRWLVLFEDFHYEIVHAPGKFNAVADALLHKLEPCPEAEVLPLDNDTLAVPSIISSAGLSPCSIDKIELALQQQRDPYFSKIMVVLESSVPSL